MDKNIYEKYGLCDGNILINEDILDKYNNVNDIFLSEYSDNDNCVNVELLDIYLDNKNATGIYHTAIKIFADNHKQNIFINDGYDIKITNQDIKESINKIFNDRLQNKFLMEHLSIFSKLGYVIESACIVNQALENKNRIKYNTWNYFIIKININNNLFYLEFDVVSRNDGENHYRLQRLKKADTQSTLPNNGEVDLGVNAFSDNNIT